MSTDPNAPTETPGPTYFNPTGDFTSPDARDVDWGDPLEDDIKSNIARVGILPKPNVRGQPGFDPNAPQCEKPTPIKSADIFNKASDIAKSLGGDEECIKQSETGSKESGKSSAFDTRSEDNLDASYSAEANIMWGAAQASSKGNLAARKADSTTTADQQHATEMQNQNLQKGCGSTLITATNMVQKQMAMQCVINNVSKTVDIKVGVQATIVVQTLPRTDKENDVVAAAKAAQAKLALQNSDSLKAITMALVSSNRPATDVIAFVKPLAEFYAKQEDNIKRSLDFFNRDITIVNSEISNVTLTSVKVFSKLETSAKSDLATLAASIQKDAVAQTMANDMGTSAMDPNVKTMAQRACESTASSSSSSITNILDSMKCSIDSSARITIVSAGNIVIDRSKITNNVTAELCSQSVVNQAVANSLSAAAQFMSDTSNTTDVTNKIAGLNDLQKALGDTVAGAIAANQAAIINSQNASTLQSQAYQDKAKALGLATLASDPSSQIIGIIIVLGILYWLFGSGSKSKPEQAFRPYRLGRA
jgi:hypothetical protein